ncbi:hypothetical protein LVD17_24620 [Fulvivirga ulvae]|uniref:Tc toxin subunit A-related protein n=1 Tax=Fulvivirga ulvae TaxID=2904245 RepID=UPI001EEA13EB|nr:neuraminidase-like domain-containing protein [Fulvivirga ulvae]UII31481.1 hypothetical protein LVD17_24620 [Fulvivirga ulvae]
MPTEAPTFTISGQVLNSKKEPIFGLRISAWDKDHEVSDYLATAYTDQQGQFAMEYDESRFYDDYKDSLPDVFFLVYQGDTVIHTTENKPIKNAEDLDGITIILDEDHVVDDPDIPKTYSVQGIVTLKETQAVVPDIKVEAWDKDHKICDQLGVSITDKSGSFYIQYPESKFKDDPKDDLPDVFFRLYAGDEMIHTTEGSPLKNIVKKKGIVIELESIAEDHQQDQPPSKDIVLNLAENVSATPQSLQKDQPKVYADIVQKAQSELQKQAASFFDTSSYALKYWAKKLKFTSLSDPEYSIADYLEEAVDNSNLNASARLEARGKLATWSGAENLNFIIQPKTPIKDNVLFESALKQADIFKLTEIIGFDEPIAQQLIARKLTLSTLGPESIKALEEDKVISQEEGRKLNLEANIYALAQGDLQLHQVIKNYNSNAPVESLKDLAAWDVEAWKEVLMQAQVEDDEKLERKARLKQKQIERLYPHETFKSRSQLMENQGIQPLMGKFYSQNAGLNFLSINYNNGAVNNINLSGFSESEQEMVLNNLKTNKRLYKITGDASDTFKLKQHYKGANEITRQSYPTFVKNTGFAEPIAKLYYENAKIAALNLGVGMINIIDILRNPLGGSPVDGADEEINEYLRRLNGYEEFFGETDFCQCDHCSSIISPAAYFTDLMSFLTEHVLDEHFTGDHTDHALNPKVRRPDLWTGLKLTCENTHELLPYLSIINEVLENFIYVQDKKEEDGGEDEVELPSDRSEIENHVYDLISLESESEPLPIRSLKQPFNLPVTALEVYLRHFPITRASIARELLAFIDDDAGIIPQADLKLSGAQYRLLQNLGAYQEEAFQAGLYDIEAGAIDSIDVQHLLQKLGIKRKQFTDLIETRFVTLNHTQALEVRASSSTGDIQFDHEDLREADAGTLDRMHRFIRLWSQLNWSIKELDQVLYNLRESLDGAEINNLYPGRIAAFVELQKELKLSIDDLCALIYQIPVEGSPSLFDRKFNMRSFIHTPEDRWAMEDMSAWSLDFRHPAYVTDGSVAGTATTSTLHRLLSGLGINDEELYALIENLKGPLGVSASDGTFSLTVANLSLIYRHVLVLKKYKLKVHELFFLIGIESSVATGYLTGFEDVSVLAQLMEWYKNSDFTVDELAFILLGSPLVEARFAAPEAMAYDIWSQIQREGNLLFTDTIFSHVEGISEDQSRAVVRANNTLLVPADLRTYRMSVEGPTTFSLTIPSPLADSLTREQQVQITSALLRLVSEQMLSGTPFPADTLTSIDGLDADSSRQILEANGSTFTATGSGEFEIVAGLESDLSGLNINIPVSILDMLTVERPAFHAFVLDLIASYMLPGAPEVSDRLFMGVGTLTLDASRDIIAANTTLFENIESTAKFWLSPDFDLSSAINIPASIPLPVEEARAILITKHISVILLNALGGRLGEATDKVDKLALLGGYDFNSPVLGSQLTRIAQAIEPLALWNELAGVLQQLAIRFKDKAFDPQVLEFIRLNTGGSGEIFKAVSPDDYRTAQLEHIREFEMYRQLSNTLKEIDILHDALASFDTSSSKFAADAIEQIAELLNAEASLISVLNDVIIFPGGGTSNEALKALRKLYSLAKLVQQLGIGAEVLPLFVSSDYNELSTAVKAVTAAIRTKYETEEAWEEKIGPLEDRIREFKRDALTDYLIHTFRFDNEDTEEAENHQWFITTNDLYNYFLIDTELMGCARTSRLVAGISSLQLYIQRCLMNLEQSEDGSVHVLPADIPAAQWEWRKNYRVWEANRKVFLYPENYIEPDLRDNKTELFTELESTLLQQKINAKNALDAYAKYMKGFEEVSSLKIAGAYHHLGDLRRDTIDQAADTLHLFGVTASEPGVYYYRTIRNIYKWEKNANKYGIQYGNWEKVNLQIPVRKVSPIIYQGKLYVFWVEIVTRPKPESEWADEEKAEYLHTFKINFSNLQLDGTWSQAQPILIEESQFYRQSDITNMPEVDENYTKRGWDDIKVFPSVDERTGNLTIANAFLNHTIVLHTRGVGEGLSRIQSYPLSVPAKRLLKSGNELGFWKPTTSSYAFKYYLSNMAFENELLYSLSVRPLCELEGELVSYDLVNGSLSDAIIDNNGDLLYLHSIPSDESFALKRVSTTLSGKMSRKLFEYGIDALLDVNNQKTEIIERPALVDIDEYYVWNDIKPVPKEGAMSVYFREVFFHIPFLIANHLNSQGKYADAQRWYHYIFNPTAVDLSGDADANPSDRVWQYIEFRDMEFDTWYNNLNDAQAIQAYENDPFNPHAIARLRLGAYRKAIVMKYIDNLLDWGDHLFARDTMESINEATLLYVMASEILGKRPAELGSCDNDEGDKTYEELMEHMEGATCTNFLNSVEDTISERRERVSGTVDNPPYVSGDTIIGANNFVLNNGFSFYLSMNGSGSNHMVSEPIVMAGAVNFNGNGLVNGNLIENDFKGIDWKDKWGNITDLYSFHTSFLKQTCAFCIPSNPDLLGYWDRVEDRLYKIRNCMNISGVRRQVALFAPEIDPRLLVRARAAGLSLDEVLNALQGELPPYRFAFLLAKAKEYAGALQSFGGALLGALEKKSAEELTLLRMAQQDEVLKMTSRLRDMEVEAAEEGLEGLRRRELTIKNRELHYQELLNAGLISEEQWQKDLKMISHALTEFSVIPMTVSGNLRFAPSILGFSNSTPTDGAADGAQVFASVLQYLAGTASRGADLLGSMASNKRREQGWQFSLEQAENELMEIEKQIEAAEIRRDISVKSRELHEKSIEQHQETFEFYRDKFTNLGLYTWMSNQLQRMFREAYQNAMTMARMAERAYRFERNDDTSVLLDGNYWDASKAGLMAGEKLMSALRQMELKYMETHTRSMEVDQAFSLTQIAPEAIIELKTTGTCEFKVPEFYFDLFYPGQYRRRVKSARLTIPCITGPYSNVSAVLTLKESYIRKEAKLDADGGKLSLVPASRTTTVATSTAQNDSGVFRLDFRDERYMPFEGAGAVESTWRLELPRTFKMFDYSSINDVILHISYTADYDVLFREKIEGANEEASGYLESLLSGSDFGLPRVFSIRQEFSQTFHRLLHRPVGEVVPLQLGERHFPLFLQGRQLHIVSAELKIELDENGFRGDDGEGVIPDTIDMELSVQGNGSVISDVTWTREAGTNIFNGAIASETFGAFLPAVHPITLNLTVNNAGNVAPETSGPGDESALDDHKVKDVYLCLAYRVSG